MNVITRFAPSPTGFIHIGNVRTALYAYLFAKKHGGTFILRIEDTDKSREVAGSIAHIKDSLTWLGIEWDDFYQQSDRLDIYKQYAEKLIEKGYAYPDPYTQKELDSFRAAAEAAQRPFLMRHHRPETFSTWDGKTPLRFCVPEIKRYHWHDKVRGDLEAGQEMLDDFILIKGDGYPTYNFAHIVDDLEMNVTHVMRGEEFISSTPKFLSLYDALDIPYPKLVTLPPIMGPDGKKKLSKRDGAKDILDYKADGYVPEAMANFLALIGWNPGGDDEIFTMEELVEKFTLDKIQKSGGAFNEEKLKWMNKEHLERYSKAEQETYVAAALPEYDAITLKKLTPTILERVHNQTEIKAAAQAGEYEWAFANPNYNTEILKWKNDTSIQEALPRLKKALELLENADFTTPDTIKDALWGYAEEVGKGELLWPLRAALSGKERSPDPFICAFVLGKTETIARINRACDKIAE